MNAANMDYEEQDFSYRSQETAKKATPPSASRRSQNMARRGKTPAQYNGMHRRRTKKMSW